MSWFTTSITALALSTALIGAGCSKKEAPRPEETAAPAAATAEAQAASDPAGDARRAFAAKCVVCHGDHGAGDGPGAAALTPKPRAFADATWQGSVTDDQIAKTIVSGGAAVGKSPIMPPNPDMEDKTDMVKELVKIVRGFKKG